ncbi:hypothetical protein PDA01_08300 [Pediococcus damnosus]|uniref:hypothetical protein n=1 Tax=Pediococcus damnosus TaxID=51663 RepID=UPI0011752FAD|nr:hypothetical protein [Pediococcus damnosus]GEA92937.1 hypothetical protein PDA01_08300 [Pediococcus damnosus]
MFKFNSHKKKEVRIGIFSLKSQSGVAKVKLEDGLYTNLIDGSDVKVKHGVIQINQNPVIIENR